MRMYEDEIRLDFRALGQEIRRKRKAKGWTQEYLAQLIDRTPHTVMYMEKRGQYPSITVFYRVVTLLDISVDQFFFSDRANDKNARRKRVDALINTLDEKELAVIEATAEGLKQAREIPDSK